MPNLKDIEAQIAALSDQDLAAFRAWFEEFQEEAWDRQIEADAEAGKLEALAQRAIQDDANGKTRPL